MKSLSVAHIRANLDIIELYDAMVICRNTLGLY